MSFIFKVSNGLRACSESEPSTKADARRHLKNLLTKDKEGKYPWKKQFEHDSFPDRTWGPYKTFPDYLANQGDGKGPGPAWSSMTVDDYRRWFHDDNEIVDLIDEAMRRKVGKPPKADILNNVKNKGDYPMGNSKEATLRRLRKDHPELHKQVLDGELSANAAAIKAGFRRVPTLLETAEKVFRKMSSSEKEQFITWISDCSNWE